MTRVSTEADFEKALCVDDLDKFIYRIFPQWALAEAFRTKQLTLVPPSFWEDPFEVIESCIGVTHIEQGIEHPQIMLGQGLAPICAQSWSSTAESDTLLRAYSRVVKHPLHKRNTYPGEEGVKVRTTPRKLIKALLDATAGTDIEAFIGDVEYLSTEELLDLLAILIAKHGKETFEDSANRVRLLMAKREGFSHEKEVRIGVILTDAVDLTGKVFKFNFEPELLFDEITFDPRLEDFERKERERDFRSLGYTGLYGASSLYQRTLLNIIIRK
jgi:hypothetical protein